MLLRYYAIITGVLFFLGALLHILKLVLGWKIAFNGNEIPTAASLIAIIVCLVLGSIGLKLAKKKK